jgi:enoyl-CoA hydratase/carnithine racemase
MADAQTAAPSADALPPGRISSRVENGVGWLIIENGKRRNALSLHMWQAVPDVLEALEADPEVKVIALRGEGDAAFASGADISEFERLRSTPEGVAAYEEAAGAAKRRLKAVRMPTVAVIRGWCVGGGLAFALDCDLRFAAEDSRYAIPAAKLGLGYGFEGVRGLVDLVGPARAKEIFFTARTYDASEARAMGLINRTAPADGFDAAAREYLKMIARGAPLTIAAVKQAANAAIKDPEARDLDSVAAAVRACFESEDYQEGRRAFMEKRKPVFRGR